MNLTRRRLLISGLASAWYASIGSKLALGFQDSGSSSTNVVDYFADFGAQLGYPVDLNKLDLFIAKPVVKPHIWKPESANIGTSLDFYFLSDEEAQTGVERRQRHIAASVRYKGFTGSASYIDDVYSYSHSERVRVIVEVQFVEGGFIVPPNVEYNTFTAKQRKDWGWVTKVVAGGSVRLYFETSIAANENRSDVQKSLNAVAKSMVYGVSASASDRTTAEQVSSSRRVEIRSSVIGGDPALIPYAGAAVMPTDRAGATVTASIGGGNSVSVSSSAPSANAPVTPTDLATAINAWKASVNFRANNNSSRPLRLWISPLPGGEFVALKELAYESDLSKYMERYLLLEGKLRALTDGSGTALDQTDRTLLKEHIRVVRLAQSAIAAAADLLVVSGFGSSALAIEQELQASRRFPEAATEIAFDASAIPTPPAKSVRIVDFTTGSNETGPEYTMRIRCRATGVVFDEVHLDITDYNDTQGVSSALCRADGGRKYLVFVKEPREAFRRLNGTEEYGEYEVMLAREAKLRGGEPGGGLGASYWSWHEGVARSLASFSAKLFYKKVPLVNLPVG